MQSHSWLCEIWALSCQISFPGGKGSHPSSLSLQTLGMSGSPPLWSCCGLQKSKEWTWALILESTCNISMCSTDSEWILRIPFHLTQRLEVPLPQHRTYIEILGFSNSTQREVGRGKPLRHMRHSIVASATLLYHMCKSRSKTVMPRVREGLESGLRGTKVKFGGRNKFRCFTHSTGRWQKSSKRHSAEWSWQVPNTKIRKQKGLLLATTSLCIKIVEKSPAKTHKHCMIPPNLKKKST